MSSYGLGLLGAALSGAGRGVSDMAGRYIDRETDDLKQQRLEEAKRLELADKEQFDIRTEQRDVLNTNLKNKNAIALLPEQARAEANANRIKQQAYLDFKTNPENVDKATNAEIRAQRGKDAYKDERLPQEIANERLKNPIDAQEAQLKLQKMQMDIYHLQNSDQNDANKTSLDAYKAEADSLNKQLEAITKLEPSMDESVTVERNQAVMVINKQLNQLHENMRKEFGSLPGDDSSVEAPVPPIIKQLQDKLAAKDQRMLPSARTALEKRYLAIVSANKGALKHLSDEELQTAIQRAESDRALAKQQKDAKAISQTSNQRALPTMPGRARYLSNLEGSL